jgi:hypothetical protein
MFPIGCPYAVAVVTTVTVICAPDPFLKYRKVLLVGAYWSPPLDAAWKEGARPACVISWVTKSATSVTS